MKLPAYPRTKPSGVEWLGDVPEHWDVKRPAPTGLRRKAQGWPEERGPTLGNASPIFPNPNGVGSSWPPPDADTTPLGLECFVGGITQGSSCLATLGWRTQRRWRWPELDALVGKVAAVVERLQEYRTARITAAVTGKIDVQNTAVCD